MNLLRISWIRTACAIAPGLFVALSLQAGELADQLRSFQPPPIQGASEQLERHVNRQFRIANEASSAQWVSMSSRADWEKFRGEKIVKLRQSLRLPKSRLPIKMHVSAERSGEGYVVKNVLYETRPHWFVTANLYVPLKRGESMPGILLSHSHHSPKTQGELQDMGATWARTGCMVLVPDHLGHGERREHPFASAKDFDSDFPVSRQDYRFRYDNSLQLYLAGESLMGWMVHDLLAGVDLLLAQPGVARDKIILLGSVAGGGDPAAVAAAVDERIACAIPFNFGGPQPETRFPLPEDAETWFDYAGGGSWESTRNLADSASDGFLPWVIVGSLAPRRLIYGHEFSWDCQRDPVWNRLGRIWEWEDAADRLAFARGRGSLTGNSPEDSHCNNIGSVHRRMIHPAFEKWFDIRVSQETEYSNRFDAADLMCWTPQLKEELNPKPLREILVEMIAEMPQQSTPIAPTVVDKEVTPVWSNATFEEIATKLAEIRCDVLTANVAEDLSIRAIVLYPSGKSPSPVAIAISQEGTKGFLERRADELEMLLHGGCIVCLAEPRGMGAFSPDADRGPNSGQTSLNASLWMLGRSLVEEQKSDLKSIISAVANLERVDDRRIYLWGDSFAQPLPAGSEFKYPRGIDRPVEADTLGGLIAILAANDRQVAGVYVNGGLISYRSVLETPFVQIPQVTIMRAVLKQTDLPRMVASAHVAMRLESLVDGCNRLVTDKQLEAVYGTRKDLETSAERSSPAKWILSQIE
jgi:cephalosporin-C deacetylase-like acetyl esterase